MLPWQEKCLAIFAKKWDSGKALQFIEKENHDLNEADANGMTLLMHLVKDPKYNPLTKMIVRSAEPTLVSLRKPLNLLAMNKNGDDAYSLATAAKNQDILEEIDVESQRKQRILNSHPETIKIGYHDTSFQSYEFIQTDLKKARFPMVGGSGGYFGGGIYFAATQQESTLKALSHGRGFECKLRMGEIYKIDSNTELEKFYQLYFGSTTDRSWYRTPSDVIRMRLLTYYGKSYDSVWGHRDNTNSNVDDRILRSGDEYVVYSADQVEIQDTFDIFNNVWFSKTQSFPDHAQIHSHRHNDKLNLKLCKPGDIYIITWYEGALSFIDDTIQFVYTDNKKKLLLPIPGAKKGNVHIPLVISRLTQDACTYYRRIIPILVSMEIDHTDVYIQKLFSSTKQPESILTSILKQYTITINFKKNILDFVHKTEPIRKSFDIDEQTRMFVEHQPSHVLQQLDYERILYEKSKQDGKNTEFIRAYEEKQQKLGNPMHGGGVFAKTTEKVLVASRHRLVYLGKRNKKYVRVKGAMVPLSVVRRMA